MLDKSGLGKGRWLRGMNALLVAEIGSSERFAEASREWLTSALTEVFPELYADLRVRPVTGRVRVSARGPLGQPGHIRGVLTVAQDTPIDWRTSLWSERSWPRFLARLEEYPMGAHVDITPLDDRGEPVHRLDGSAAVSVARQESAAGWVSFGFKAPAADTGWPDSLQVQERWAEFVREQAAKIGACAGGMTDDYELDPETSLERSLMMAGVKVGSWATVREQLRGYWWVTIVPRELADLLGGPEVVAASGAFHEVSPLPDGSLWLRATPTINEFTGDRIRNVFEALAPVLPVGTTQFLYGAEFRILEGVDAAEYQQAAEAERAGGP